MEFYRSHLRDLQGFSLDENSNPFRGAEVYRAAASRAVCLDDGGLEAPRRPPGASAGSTTCDNAIARLIGASC